MYVCMYLPTYVHTKYIRIKTSKISLRFRQNRIICNYLSFLKII
jgi:hypothetical protein